MSLFEAWNPMADRGVSHELGKQITGVWCSIVSSENLHVCVSNAKRYAFWKGLSSRTIVPPELLSMNLLTFQQYSVVWLFQHVEVMTWTRKFTEMFVLLYLAWHPGHLQTGWLPSRIPKWTTCTKGKRVKDILEKNSKYGKYYFNCSTKTCFALVI